MTFRLISDVKSLLKYFFPFVLLIITSLACNFPSTAPSITSAWLAQDYEGGTPTSVYSPEDIFYCIATLESSETESAVSAVWTAVSAAGVEPNMFIDQVELTTGSGTLHFELSNAGPWPAGSYKVELFLNGMLDRAIEFTVQ